jgi:superfamily I DNA/RNA helicase
LKRHSLTLEQKLIVHSDSPLIYVSARAGTGKTTTLTEFVKVRKADSFLYIVYNNAIKNEAIGKFPPSTVIHTIHSLAYSVIGKNYSHKLGSNLKALDIFLGMEEFKDKDFEDPEIYEETSKIAKMINDFCNSAAKCLQDLFPESPALLLAIKYWEEMIDLDSETNITFDGYLKLYHLSNPVLNYDYIMVDEAQDSNEVMLDIVFKQSSRKIFVGDQHQRIYSFRGAIDIFTDSRYFDPESDHELLSLTESFRFGEKIAEIANVLLSDYKHEHNLITGTDLESKICRVDTDVQYTIITRTNSHLFDLAYDFATQGKKIHIVGSNKGMFKDILDGYYLFAGDHKKIESEYIRKFKNFKHLEGVAKNTGAKDLLILVKIVKKYGANLFKAIDRIQHALKAEKFSDVILTTAHKSKGLEFINVKIADDFMELYDENGFKIPVERIDLEEINLLYVSITRAKYDLELNRELTKLWREKEFA